MAITTANFVKTKPHWVDKIESKNYPNADCIERNPKYAKLADAIRSGDVICMSSSAYWRDVDNGFKAHKSIPPTIAVTFFEDVSKLSESLMNMGIDVKYVETMTLEYTSLAFNDGINNVKSEDTLGNKLYVFEFDGCGMKFGLRIGEEPAKLSPSSWVIETMENVDGDGGLSHSLIKFIDECREIVKGDTNEK